VTPVTPRGGSAPDSEGDIQLWTASLDLVGLELGTERSLLSEEELERARRLRFDGDRARFVAGRVWLRLLLAERLEVAVSEIRLQTAAGGKPELAPPLPAWLRFSMSRSGSRGLYALARGSEVGVDLEDRSRVVDVEAVGSRYFSQAERDVVAKLAEDQKQRGFYGIWTRKEAVLKAMGIGLDAPIAALDVTGAVASWDPARPGVPSTAGRWWVHDLDVAPGYAAALAVEGALSQGVPIVRRAAELLQDLDR
jgi:4'-phosphopantetheinyl transferase